VIQRNLVYTTNLPMHLGREEVNFNFIFVCPINSYQILRKNEYFGQYGKIQKVVINRHNAHSTDPQLIPSISAYITYYKKEDAIKAIQAVNGAWVEGQNGVARQLR
jgi:hypothetical protein